MSEANLNGAEINLQTFFNHVFDGEGRIIEPSGCDTALYLSMMENVDMCEADKAELIHTLWRTLDQITRVQFGFDPLTDIMNEKAALRANPSVAMVNSSTFKTQEKSEGDTE